MASLREILCTTELERPARSALRYSFFLAERFHCALHVVHGRGPVEDRPPTQMGRDQRLEQVMGEQRVRQRLDAVVRAIPTGASGRATTHVVDGDLSEAALSFMERQRCDLVVLESKLDSESAAGPRELAVQSIANAATCPLLTVPSHDLQPAPRLQHILLVLEPAFPVRSILDWTALFASRFAAVIDVLYIQSTASTTGNDLDRQFDVEDVLRRAGVGVETRNTVQGDALSERILTRAEQAPCDLIVMSTHLQVSDRRALMQVRRQSDVPILSVRETAPDRAFVQGGFEGGTSDGCESAIARGASPAGAR